MHDKHIKQLPVIDPVTGRIVGTVHRRDVLRVFTRPAAELEAEIRALLPDPDALTIEIDGGVVTIGGRVTSSSRALALVETVRGVEGVVDVVSEIAYDRQDLMIVPPLM
jgi:CBS-domain-containing membrane protein